MERVAADTRVVALSTALERPRAAAEPVAETVAVPDPRALLEQERLRVLEEAAVAGHAEGLKRAQSEIGAAVEKAEARIRDANAREDERLRTATQEMQELLRNLEAEVSALDERLDEIVIEAAFAALVRVLGAAAADGSLVRDLCRQALSEYRQRPVTIKVASSVIPALAELVDTDAVRIAGDARLAVGECRLETHKGSYDTGIEVRLEALKQAFLRSIRMEEA